MDADFYEILFDEREYNTIKEYGVKYALLNEFYGWAKEYDEKKGYYNYISAKFYQVLMRKEDLEALIKKIPKKDPLKKRLEDYLWVKEKFK